MPVLTQPITVIKRAPDGGEIWRYTGTLLRWDTHAIVLEAYFQRSDISFMGLVLRTGDRFIETYFTDRWYNIYEIHDRDDDRLKGWYCNIGKPAVIEAEDVISYVDLALDLWIAPDGTSTILDEEEFTALDLDLYTKSRARAALDELMKCFSELKEPGPF
jgi:predicted RNA-binding protein associated with RNAse of E/G family